MRIIGVTALAISVFGKHVDAFAPLHSLIATSSNGAPTSRTSPEKCILRVSNQEWDGEVVPNQGGTIRGCSLTPVGDFVTEWTIAIDGIEADLGNFGLAIYKKLLTDSKQQRYQGFRPGTIPPHLLKTFKAFAMDECARETVLEAMQQNNLRPFTDARQDMKIENVSIPPPAKKAPKKKSKKRKSKQTPPAPAPAPAPPTSETETETVVEAWRTFDGMDGAINAGWEPGQSFSFVATNVRGQKVLSEEDVAGSRPLGVNY